MFDLIDKGERVIWVGFVPRFIGHPVDKLDHLLLPSLRTLVGPVVENVKSGEKGGLEYNQTRHDMYSQKNKIFCLRISGGCFW